MVVVPGYKQTEVGVIPEDWEVKKVGEVCGWIVPGRNKPKIFEGDIPWITTPDLEDGKYVNESRLGLCVTKDEARKVGSRIVPKDSVLMSCAGELGIFAIAGRDIVVNQQLHVFTPAEATIPKFLLSALAMQKAYIASLSTTTAVAYLNKDNCNSIPIPLPNLIEQRLIAAALSDADALIESLEQLIAKKRAVKQGAMQELLTGRRRLPGFEGEWAQLSLGDLFTFKNGLNKGKEFFGHGTSIVNYMDVFNNSGIYSSQLEGRVSLTAQELQNFDVKKGDVFFTRTSETIEEIGVAAVVLDNPVNTVFSGFVLRARPKDKRLCDAFKAYCFQTRVIRTQITSQASYTTRALTNGKALSRVMLDVPSVEEQIAIATVLSDLDAEVAALEAKLAKARQVKQGMMQELLTGRTRLI